MKRFESLIIQARKIDAAMPGAPLELFPYTEQQLRVIRGVLDGKNNQTIANDLFVTVYTVKDHLSRIYKIAGVHSRLELATKFASSR